MVKIGAGGFDVQVAQDAITSKQNDQARLKPPMEQELLQAQKLGAEINKPVLHPGQSAELTGYLRRKDTAEEKKKRNTGNKRKQEKKPDEPASLKKDSCSGLKGLLIDKYM